MAEVQIGYQWDEGQRLDVSVVADSSYPDIIDEISHRAIYLLNEALATVSTPAPEPAPEREGHASP